ncbi:hypothetical protein AAG906_003298 [Vitis piasezkii]
MESRNIDKSSLLTSEAASCSSRAQSTTNMNIPSVASTSTADDEATEVIEARVIDTSESMVRLASSRGPEDIFNPLPKSTTTNINQCAKHRQANASPVTKWNHKITSHQPPFSNWNGTVTEATHFEPMAPQSHARHRPPQVTMKKCENVIG